MITHNATFETLAQAPVKRSDVIVARQLQTDTGYTDDTLKWTASDVLMSVQIDSVGEMLGVATKKAVVKLLGIINGANAGDLFQVRLGLYDSSQSAFNYISQGFYLVDSVAYDYDAGSTTVTLYDHMWEASKLNYGETVSTDAITYPTSVNAFALYLASLLNLDLGAGFENLPNSTYMISQDLYTSISGATIQNAIQDIAGATGTTARVSDTSLVFSQYTPTSENLDSNTLKTLKIGDTYGPVTSVILGRQPQNDNIAVYAATPTNPVVSNVNTTSDIMTATGHGMATGNMVYFMTDGTLPAPIVKNTPYYVIVLDGDNFQLAPTYTQAMNNSGVINFTTAGTGTLQIVPTVTKEIQINNNEILDDDRQTLVGPLYNSLSGIYWSDVKTETIGLGWHEVGDVINFTQGLNTVRAFLNEVHVTLAGSIKESLVSTVPTVQSINYQAAGGVMKSIYDTEIKVDKQAQTITSIVSRQDTLEQNTSTDYSQIYQDIANILLTVQKAGGGNLIQNSVGFATESKQDVNLYNYDALTFWTYNPDYQQIVHGTVKAYSSSESQNAGGVSGQVVEMNGASVYVEQRIAVAAGTPLSFGIRVNNQLSTGGATITLYNDIDTFTVTLDQGVNYIWEELAIENFQSTMPWLKVKIQASNAQSFKYTDLRVTYGTTLTSWVQSAQEILATNIQFTKLGMKIYDNVHNTETRVTYNEFSTRRRSDGAVLFEANDTGVVTRDLTVKGATSYNDANGVVIKQVTIPKSSALGGIAWIKV